MRNAKNTGGWTDELVERLKKLWADGVSCSWIAAELGCGLTRNAVIGKVHRLGLSARGERNSSRAAGRKISQPDRRLKWRQPTNLAITQIVAAPKAPEHLGILFGDLKDGATSQCRFIHGDNEKTPFTYCGQPVQASSSYCEFHHRLCYHRLDPKARKTFIPARGAA